MKSTENWYVIALLAIGILAPRAFAQNPKLLKDINPGPASGTTMHSRSVGDIRSGVYYFGASDGTNGNELWRTDGTTLGTWLVKDVYAGSGHGVDYISQLDCHNGSTGPLFVAGNNGTNGIELWRSDGATSNTVLVKNIFADKPKSASSSYPSTFTLMNGITYFKAAVALRRVNVGVMLQDVYEVELFRSNGTAAGTSLVKDLAPRSIDGTNPSDLHVMNNVLYFYGNVEGAGNARLCRSDGTANGTFNVYAAAKLMWNWYTRMEPCGNTLFYKADDSTHGVELWASDGSRAGTRLVKDIHTTGSADPRYLLGHNGVLYFTADNGINGRELWRSDGTAVGTTMVADINPGPGSSTPLWITPMNGMLYFTAVGPVSGDVNAPRFRQLWRSDGTASGTTLVAVINPTGDCEPEPTGMFYFDLKFPVLNGLLYISATDGSAGRELWRSDGTAAGTTMVKDVNPGAAGSDPYSPRVLNGKIVYHATHASYGNELWMYDPSQPVSKSPACEVPGHPADLRLHGNHPNPFRPTTLIIYTLPRQGHTRLSLYDLLGRELRVLLDAEREAGEQSTLFQAAGLPAGNYLVRLDLDGATATRVVTVLP